jgi:para-nitrobenzyl esterase
MKYFFILLLVYTYPFTSLLAQGPIVQTSEGKVKGTLDGNISVFKGIPYAAPPVGDLRWKNPQPTAKWKDVKDCTRFPASAIQPPPVPFMMWTEEFIAPPEPLSEDCLFLNIWSPAKKGKEKFPVLVWLHGGGFTGGAGSCAVYDGEEMAKKGIVFVSINYRLGIFGFFAHPELSRESVSQTSGNYGLLDQIAALKWVQQNISAFGGDPAGITIAGQSAGSISVYALIASPLAKGLFHGAIAQSGGLLNGLLSKTKEAAEMSGTKALEKAGYSSISSLKNLPADELQIIGSKMPWGSFGLVCDGIVLPTNLDSVFRNGLHNDVPILTGWVTGDGSLMGSPNLSAEKFIRQTTQNYGSRSNEFLEIFPATTDKIALQSQEKNALLQFAGITAYRLSLYNHHSSFVYQFSFVPTDKPDFPNYGAFHTSEVPFAYHNLAKWKRPWQKRDFKMEEIMTAYWVNFIKTGDPNGKGLPLWKAYDRAVGNIMVLDEQTIMKPGLFKKEFNFFENVK